MENQLHVLQYHSVIQRFSLLTNEKPFAARSEHTAERNV